MRQSTKRREEILKAIASGENDVNILASQFGISTSTIRRDLQHLSGKKVIMRTYGGAMLLPPTVEDEYPVREMVNHDAKLAIAEAAARRINDGETIILDGGSTVTCLGQFIKGRNLSIITNNISLASLLAGAPNISLVFLGGAVRSISLTTYGPLAEDAMRSMTAAKYFTSGNGIVAQRGICEASLEQISLKRIMMRQVRETIVLADASKLGCTNQPAWLEMQMPWTLITNANEAQCKSFVDEGANVIYV